MVVPREKASPCYGWLKSLLFQFADEVRAGARPLNIEVGERVFRSLRGHAV